MTTTSRPKCGDEASLGRHFHLRRKRRGCQPPLTPMIDIVFQLLLFFLLTMQFRRAEGVLPANLPAPPAAAAVTPVEPVEVHLHTAADGQLRIEIPLADTSTTSWASFRTQLRSISDQLDGSETQVLIVPDAATDWQNALNAYNQVRMCEIKQINFLSQDSPK